MANDSNENSLQNNSQDDNIESSDEVTESSDPNAESNDANENINTENNNATSADQEADIGNLERPKTNKLAQNNLPIIFLIVAVMGAIVVAYFMLSDKKGKKPGQDQVPLGGEKPATSKKIPVPSLAKSSAVPKNIIAVTPPPPKKIPIKPAAKSPPPATIPSLLPSDKTAAVSETKKIAAKQNRRTTKVKSSIMLQNSGSSPQKEKGNTNADTASSSGTFNPDVTSASTTKLTKIGNMSTTITQGKILDAILETPINTLYPGPIRALISRDVYSERGSNVLIQKGSKVIGTLKGGYTAGQTRVAVSWTRIILPNGYDIAISNAPGVGKLGMIGVEGVVNRQFMETIGNTALLSLINISTAKIIEDQFNVGSSSTITNTSSSGNITTTSSKGPTQQAAEDAVNNLSSVTKDWLSKNFLVTPYIVINQGTRVKVFVNQDIRFPQNINSSVFVK